MSNSKQDERNDNFSDPVSTESIEVANVEPQAKVRWSSVVNGLMYWFKLVLQPVIAVATVIALAFGFGYAQRNFDLFNNAKTSAAENSEEDALYACSMLCVFVKAPGRCPVCGMELQKIEQSSTA